MHRQIHQIESLAVYFIPVETRVPLKFGPEVLTSVTCARVRLTVTDQAGVRATGWGETPLSVQWVWPAQLPYAERYAAMKAFTGEIAREWLRSIVPGHALEIGHEFTRRLAGLLKGFNAKRSATGVAPMPWLAALVCSSPFDIALHDAFGNLVQRPVYQTYTREFLSADLSQFLEPDAAGVSFDKRFPSDYLLADPPKQLVAWHLVGGLDCLESDELSGTEPTDGHPVLLRDWIRRDGLQCLKIKLRGNDSAWDFTRLGSVGKIALENGVKALSADFNCTVSDPEYVNEILDRLVLECPDLSRALLYVEQPFPYELEDFKIDVHSVSARKPLFLDESAHDWRMVRLGRSLGWSGVALKTCKTQTGAVLSACWAKAHGMQLMVQDLTNPMLAQIPHVLLAAHVGTIMGVETNAMQYYPNASLPEAAVHPGLYERRCGAVRLDTIRGSGFGYRLSEIHRRLPEPEWDLH